MLERHPEPEHVKIKLNNRPVTLTTDDATGAAIKAAGIAQGVEIKADFVLSAKAHDGKWDTIGDDQPVEVHDGEQFRAVAPEEHS